MDCGHPKFPAHLVTPIALHHLSLGTLRSTAPRAVTEAATLSLANRLAHCLMLGQSGNDTVHSGRDMAAALSMTPETIARICAEVPEQTADLKLAILARGGGCVDRKEPEWMGLLPPKKDLRLAYLSTQPVLDGLGLLCQRLGPREEHEPPTAAVVFLASPKERAPVSASLAVLEGEHGLKNLPLVVLSAAGTLSLETGAMAEVDDLDGVGVVEQGGGSPGIEALDELVVGTELLRQDLDGRAPNCLALKTVAIARHAGSGVAYGEGPRGPAVQLHPVAEQRHLADRRLDPAVLAPVQRVPTSAGLPTPLARILEPWIFPITYWYPPV